MAQWLGLYAFTATGPGSISGWETDSPTPQGTAKQKATFQRTISIKTLPKQYLQDIHGEKISIHILVYILPVKILCEDL